MLYLTRLAFSNDGNRDFTILVLALKRIWFSVGLLLLNYHNWIMILHETCTTSPMVMVLLTAWENRGSAFKWTYFGLVVVKVLLYALRAGVSSRSSKKTVTLLLVNVLLKTFFTGELSKQILLYAGRLLKRSWLCLSVLVEVWTCAVGPI